MSNDADTSLDILIRLIAETQGADAAQAALDKAKISTDKLANATEDASKTTNKFHGSARGMESVLRVIATELGPDAGLALSSIAFAGTNSMLLASLAVRELFEWLEKLEQKANEVRDTLANTWIGSRDAANDAAKAAQDFAEAMQRSADFSGDLKRNLDSAQTILDAEIASHKKLLDALEKEQLAGAAGDKQKEEDIKRRFDDLKRDYDLVAESMKLEKQRDDLTTRQAQLRPKLKDAATQAEADMEEEIGNSAAIQASARQASAKKGGKDEVKMREAATKAADGLEDLKRLYAEGEGPGGAVTAEQIEAQAELGKDIEERQKIVDEFNAYERDVETVRRHTEAVEKLTKAKDKATDAYNKNEDTIRDETEAVKTGEKVLQIHRVEAGHEADLDLIERSGVATDAGASAFVQKFLAAQTRLGQRHGTGDDSQTIQLMNQLLQASQQSDSRMLLLLRDLIAHKGDINAALADLAKQLGNVASRTSRPTS